MRSRLGPLMIAVALIVAVGCALGAGVRSTRGGQAAVDEPEYLLTALSLAEDRDLSIGDELRERRYREFHQAALPVQTSELPGGRRLSPHDPLLAVVLAAPMGLGGWVAAKLTMAALAGLLAALLLWTAVRRLSAPAGPAAAAVALGCLAPPLAVYGSQVYPEIPAALAVTAAAASLLGPLGRSGSGVLLVSVVALPWLSVKYVPVAAVLAALGAWRLWLRRPAYAVSFAGVLGLAGVAYLAVHRAVWGGWTVYATGDHFESTGEFAVVGTDPHLLGRSSRLVALLTDRDYGLLVWAPVWLLLPVAVGALAARRDRASAVLLAPLAAGWLTATFVALTMHGFWWPGRQVVVVLPLALLALIAWAGNSRTRANRLIALSALGCLSYLLLVAQGWSGSVRWVRGFQDSWVHSVLRRGLPAYEHPDLMTWVQHAAWGAAFLAFGVLAWRRTRNDRPADVRDLVLTS